MTTYDADTTALIPRFSPSPLARHLPSSQDIRESAPTLELSRGALRSCVYARTYAAFPALRAGGIRAWLDYASPLLSHNLGMPHSLLLLPPLQHS